MTRMSWDADPSATPVRRLGRSPRELGNTDNEKDCPDIWLLDNGDIAVVGRDMTVAYAPRLPADLHIAADERLVVIPRSTILSAKDDLPDA